MRRLTIAVAATISSIALTQIASAADLPRKAPAYTPPPPPPVYSWTGFYVGGNVGYSWGRAKTDCDHSGLDNLHPVLISFFGHDFAPDLTDLPTSCSDSLKPDGAIAGGQIGYNWQINNWVIGLEGDLQWSGQKDSRSQHHSDHGFESICFLSCGALEVTLDESATADSTLEAKLRWFSTVRGRAGVLVAPSVLLYGTGGLAFGGINVSGSGVANATTTGCAFFLTRLAGCLDESVGGSYAFSQSKTKFGWTLGGGVETVLAPNWTVKAEYLYMDLGSVSGSVPDNFGGTVSWNTKFTDNIVRVGFNYRFY